MSTEDVMVVRTELLSRHTPPESGRPGVLLTGNTLDIINLIHREYEFIPRESAEKDFTFKQIIPYVTVRYGDEYLLLKRTENQTEERLHNKYSLGVGGHINPSEAEAEDPLLEGLYRELNEEVRVPEPFDLSFEGIIHDETSSVSRVHLGLFHVIDLKSKDFEIQEQENMTGLWVTGDALEEYFDKMESWSQIVYTFFIKKKGN